MKAVKANVLFLGLLAISPFTWYILGNFKKIISLFIQTPDLVSSKLGSVFALYNLRFILELRHDVSFLSRLYFNKLTLFYNDFNKVFTLISPKLYFVDNLVFEKFEMIPFFLVPFWFVGLIFLLKKLKLFPFILLFGLSVFAWITNTISVDFLFLPAIVNLYFVYLGIKGIFYEKF